MDKATLEVVSQLGSFGLVALAVTWFILKGVPMVVSTFERLQSQHRAERDNDRAAFLTALKENTASINGVGNKVDELHEKLDAFSQRTMRG